ncbi:hypothetical protein [Methylovirgula sp. HY1]|uniref:hypothetical protein n=1 Tax=Methylovirgula sp. HY1 TaxID=2822761 RepID=UPI001C5B5B55|nr:hypothetical protein [Methylovirgula sp. HY1]QXX74593.1 Transposon Tn7 transposition protein TnsB [Methylovirgula sp. HY1]
MTDDGAFILPRNAVLEDSETGTRLRVVEIHSASRTVWLFSIDGKGWPFKAGLAETEQGFRDGRYKFMPPIRPFKPGKAGRAHTLHERRYELIDPLVSGENSCAILNKDARRRLIRERAVEKKTSRQYVEKLLKAWWKKGMNFEALAPGFHLCGARGKKRHLGERKVGRPRIYTDNAGINVTIEIRRMMTIAADFYIAGNGKQTITKAFDYLIELFFMTSEKDEHGIPRPKIIEDRPSERQFAYFIDTHYSNRQKRKARIGAAQYELQERPMLGKATQDIQGPGDRFEIDATIADVYLVSQFDQTRIVGRPVIYCSVDVYSGLITGIYIGFEGPSWIGVLISTES